MKNIETTVDFRIEELSSPRHTQYGKRFWSRHGFSGVNGLRQVTSNTLEGAREEVAKIRTFYRIGLKRRPPQLRIRKFTVKTEIQTVK